MNGKLEKLLADRELPELTTREEMKELLLREEYGYVPQTPYEMSVKVTKEKIEGRLDLGRACLSEAEMTITTEYGSHTFPFKRLLHNDGKKHPFFVFMNFDAEVPAFYYPAELIAERGFDVLSFYYEDVVTDDNDFENGLAKVLMNGDRSSPTACGKLVLWAFAASRLLDYAGTLDCLDMSRAAVHGHSRLGKTALVAGMLDERFRFVCSNNAGCSGDALAKGSSGQTGYKCKNGGTGESYEVIHRVFPYWFCGNFAKYTEKNYAPDFDQHFLLACTAPRFLHVAASDLDDWADPESEQLCCLAAGKMWERMGLPGLIHNDEIVDADTRLHEGRVGFYRRSGYHFVSYHNWIALMNFIEKHEKD